MQLLPGTSGYSFKEWLGHFYPDKLPASEMLRFYASNFSTVEINNTFYRMPPESMLLQWPAQVPDDFTFTLKAPRRITHDAKLQRCEDLTQSFCRTARTLGTKLGALLFQLPPTFKRDDAVLNAFLELLPEGTRAAFEFRHASWHDAAVFEALKRRNIALCVADSEKMSTPVVSTADYAYFRLRDEGYQRADVERWASVIRAQPISGDAFVYFKHEEQGKGPEFAKLLIGML